jgi:hypothetical protein
MCGIASEANELLRWNSTEFIKTNWLQNPKIITMFFWEKGGGGVGGYFKLNYDLWLQELIELSISIKM